jgi:hypothetical protein
MSEMQPIYAGLGLAPPGGNPRPEDLLVWLSDCGQQLSERGTLLVVILDGLDHVWSDAGSVEELNKLFQLVAPVPPGAVLLIGTQPVDYSRLPKRLSDVAPRESWLDVPALEYPAVRRWAEIHAGDLRAIRNGEPDSHTLDELAGALWRRSEGYPLHLRYLLKSLEAVEGYITTRDIERLPELSHRDITPYYARFWEDLPDESKQVLSLLATCDFPWSRSAIAECLDPGCRNLAIDGAIRRVAHLTSEGLLGLQFAHSSLEFFVRQHIDYQNYRARVRKLALGWLRTRAPDVLRWSYEWLLAAEGGDEEPLLQGPSRAWLIDGMARCYPVDIADRILTRSAWIALQRGQLDRFVELGLLSDYLSEATDSRDYVVEPLLAPQLAIREDPTVLDRFVGELKSLGNLELLCLAESCERAGMTAVVGECFNRLNARIRMGQAGQHGAYPRMDAGRCLARLAAFASGIEPPNVLDWLRSQAGNKFGRALWRDYFVSLRANRRAERLRAVVNGTDDVPAERARALSHLVLLACEDGLEALAQDFGKGGDSLDPFVVLAKTLRGESNDLNVPVAVPEPWVLRLKEYELYQYYDEMAEYLWLMFFVFTANCLCEKEDENVRLAEPFVDKGWVSDFLACSASAAAEFAKHLRSRRFVTYSWIFAQFSEVHRPDSPADRFGHGFATAARKAIFRLAMDLQAVQASIHSPMIDANDIEVVRRMPLLVLPVWLEITAAYRRAWFTADGLARTLVLVDSHLGSTIDDFGSRAELCGLGADLTALHGDCGATAKWVRECWSNLIAYGYHKDMLLDQCLDAAKHLHRAGSGADALDLLEQLSPAVSGAGDYTDGDETRHLPERLGSLLFDIDFQWFVRYHEWLCSSGEYWDAHSIFKGFVSKADLSNRVFRAVAETAVERENLLTLAERSIHGDANATECLQQLSLFHLPSGDSKAKRTSPVERSRLVESGPMPDPGSFPPDNFRAYLEAAQAAGTYREDEDVDRWARLWASRGHKASVLDVLEAYDSSRHFLSGDSKLRFELTLNVKGRQAAYDALVAAQRRRYGWNRYYSRSEDIQYVWGKLKEIYPDRWLAFLQSTLMSDPERVNRSGVTVQTYISRLVEFLLFMDQPEIAKATARAATKATLQLVPLKLPPPTWIPGGTQ